MALPHVFQFAGIVSAGYKNYFYQFDEARRQSYEDGNIMRRDAFLMSLLNERKLAVASLNWHLECEDEEEPEQRKIRDHIDRTIRGIYRFRRIPWQLLDAMWYGRMGVQCKWDWIQKRMKEEKLPEEEGNPEQVAAEQGEIAPPANRMMRYFDESGKFNLDKAMNGEQAETPEQLIKTLTVRKFEPVNGDKIRYLQDGTPYICVYGGETIPSAEEILSTPIGSRGLVLRGSWRQRFIIHSHEQDDADFFDFEKGEAIHGIGIRNYIFWMNFMRQEELARIAGFMDRVGLGVTVVEYEEGNEAAEKAAAKAAQDVASDRNVVVMPKSRGSGRPLGGLYRVETPVSGAEVLYKMVERLEKQLERYMVGQEASSKGEGSRGLGNEASAEFQQDTKFKITAFDADNLEETLTGNVDEPGLIWMIQNWSFPGSTEEQGGFRIRWKFDVATPASEKRLNAAKIAQEMGCDLKESEVLEMAGLSKPGPQDKVLSGRSAPTPFQGGIGPDGEPKKPFNEDTGEPNDTIKNGKPNGFAPKG